MGQAFKPIALVVKDDQDQRDLLMVLLKESDLQVFGCESAEAARRLLNKFGSGKSLLVTDIQLAGNTTSTDMAPIAKRRHPTLLTSQSSSRRAARSPSCYPMLMPKPWRAPDILKKPNTSADRSDSTSERRARAAGPSAWSMLCKLDACFTCRAGHP